MVMIIMMVLMMLTFIHLLHLKYVYTLLEQHVYINQYYIIYIYVIFIQRGLGATNLA